ncbi:MAG: ABC transporter permease subunit [Thermoplasmata archaeon]|nr:ABC transporter permease subunit [Thermoplasmata archaeon]MCI4362308.1 ABC transporter permease subunit [Thermoplasmata archaeon]
MSDRSAGVVPLLPVVAFVAAFAIVPAALLLATGTSAAGGIGGLAKLAADPLNQQAFSNSLLQGGLSAGVAVALGAPAGVFLGRYTFRGRSELLALLIVPFLLPTLAVVLGVETIFGTGGILASVLPGTQVLGSGLGGIVTANVLYNAPVVTLLTAVGVESSAPALEETVATLGGGPLRAFRDAWGRSALLGAAAGAVLTFLFSALAFAAPLLLCGARCYTVEARIWSLDQVLLTPAAAAGVAFLLVALLALPAAAYLALVARLRAARRSAERPARRVPWRNPWVWPAVGATVALSVAVVGLLGAVLDAAARPVTPGAGEFSAFAQLFGPAVTGRLGVSTLAATGNTVFFATVATALALLFAIGTGFGLSERPGAARWLRALVFAPLVVSPVVLSFALAQFWRPVFGGTSTVGVLILLAQATLAIPFALPAVEVALRRVPRSLRESAETLGQTPWSAYLDVELPLVRDGLVTAGLFAFALSFGEFTATYFLATPTFTTLPVELYRLDEIREPALAAAVAGLLVVVSLVSFLVIVRGGRRVEF